MTMTHSSLNEPPSASEVRRMAEIQSDLADLEAMHARGRVNLLEAISDLRTEAAASPFAEAWGPLLLDRLAISPEKPKAPNKRWVAAAIEQWMPLLEEGRDIGCDWAEARTHCWRCGCERSLQRCHMVPKALGGTLEPGNVMPLCADCHAEAPDTDDRADFLAWVKETRNRGNYESYWAERCWREAGLPPPASQEHANAVLLEWLRLIATSSSTHRTHFATSTKVALLKRAHSSTPAQP